MSNLSCRYLSKVLRLLYQCPVSKDNPRDCALHEIRKKSELKRDTWAKMLKPSDQEKIITIHKYCPARKRKIYTWTHE